MVELNQCPACGNTEFLPRVTTKDYTVTGEEFQIVTCRQCTLGITTPRPADNQLPNYYESQDYISHTNKASSLIDHLYLLARKITLRQKTQLLKTYAPGSTILDYGCGTGNFLAYLNRQGFNTAGVEPSPAARKIANDLLPNSAVTQSLSEIPGNFDAITLWHVLEHVSTLDETLQELKQKLNSNGRIIIAVPTLNSWESDIYGTHWAAYDTPRHLWHFNRKSMQTLLNRNGLKLAAIKPMKLDSFYISLLSEKYRNNQSLTITSYLRAFINGLRSNLKAASSGDYSSLIYLAENEHP